MSNAGERFDSMTSRLSCLLTTKIDNRKPSEVGRGLDDKNRFLRMMLTLILCSGEVVNWRRPLESMENIRGRGKNG